MTTMHTKANEQGLMYTPDQCHCLMKANFTANAINVYAISNIIIKYGISGIQQTK